MKRAKRHGNTSTPSRVESADGGRADADQPGVQDGDSLDLAEGLLTRALERLEYGRRQEAEEAISILSLAREVIRHVRHRESADG